MRDLIEKTLSELLPPKAHPLFEEASYSLEGGKRLRPLLTLGVAKTYGIPLTKALWPACALELVHIYSLIHDDLPCMDNDDFRRGKPTLHRAYSEEDAILTGDLLLTYAFEVLSTAPELSDSQKIKLIKTLSKRAGVEGMIGGQFLDIRGEGIDLQTVQEMEGKKTGALITAALEFGAILAEVDPTPLIEIGSQLGLAYQLVDDLIDQDGVLLLIGKEKVQSLITTLFNRASTLIAELPNKGISLQELAEEMLFRTV